MIITTGETIAGKEITMVLGLVRGNVVRARHIGSDIIAGLRTLVGGELPEYTKLMAEAREQALDRMEREARLVSADAVIGLRFTTSMIMRGSAEILVYGTAVKLGTANMSE